MFLKRPPRSSPRPPRRQRAGVEAHAALTDAAPARARVGRPAAPNEAGRSARWQRGWTRRRRNSRQAWQELATHRRIPAEAADVRVRRPSPRPPRQWRSGPRLKNVHIMFAICSPKVPDLGLLADGGFITATHQLLEKPARHVALRKGFSLGTSRVDNSARIPATLADVVIDRLF